jgi:hypothetical protein
MSNFNQVASTNSTNLLPVQAKYDANGNCLGLFGQGGNEITCPINATTINATNIYAASEIGYTLANNSSVTQLNNKTTGVTINTSSGQIVTANSQLAPSAQAVFVVTNSSVSANDNVICSIASGGTLGAYNVFIAAIANGSFTVVIKNSTNNAYSEAVTLNYSILHTAS